MLDTVFTLGEVILARSRIPHGELLVISIADIVAKKQQPYTKGVVLAVSGDSRRFVFQLLAIFEQNSF